MEILTSLKEFHFVKDVEVVVFDKRDRAYHLKLAINLSNGDLIYSNEFVTDTDRKYSYHWQNQNGELIIRWDNAPHHQTISTFPFHLHTAKGITESIEMNLTDVFNHIKRSLK